MPAIGKAKADLKALIAQKAYTERAGLDPDRQRAMIRRAPQHGGQIARTTPTRFISSFNYTRATRKISEFSS